MYGINVITKEDILRLRSEVELWDLYIEGFIEPYIPFCSEIREDNNPSCCIQYWRGGLIYKDFGTGESYNIFSYVSTKYGLSKKETLEKIYKDITEGKEKDNTTPSLKNRTKEYKEIRIRSRRWNNTVDKQYWGSYGLSTKILDHFNVIPCRFITIGDSIIRASRSNPIYAYKIEDRFKILRPYSDIKWLSNATKHHVQGMEQLTSSEEDLYITTSLKDVMVLYTIGKASIAPQSETSLIPKYIIDHLKERFRNIYTIPDKDSTGENFSNMYIENYGIYPIHIRTDHKDPGEIVKNTSLNNLKKLIEDENCKRFQYK